MKVRYNFFLMVIGCLHLPCLSRATTPPNQSILSNLTNSAPSLLEIVQNGYYRPISKAICDQQFLGEVQASIGAYSDLFEKHRQTSTTKLPLKIAFLNSSNSPSVTKVDEAALFRKTMRTQAMIQRCWISSMVIPGLGQIYNKDYWKVPCFYLGVALLGYKIYSEHEEMHRHQRDALARSAFIHNNKVNPAFTDKRIKECERTRNLFIIIASAWYLLNILDAYAGGHDKTVNFNKDIQAKPTALLEPAAAPLIS